MASANQSATSPGLRAFSTPSIPSATPPLRPVGGSPQALSITSLPPPFTVSAAANAHSPLPRSESAHGSRDSVSMTPVELARSSGSESAGRATPAGRRQPPTALSLEGPDAVVVVTQMQAHADPSLGPREAAAPVRLGSASAQSAEKSAACDRSRTVLGAAEDVDVATQERISRGGRGRPARGHDADARTRTDDFTHTDDRTSARGSSGEDGEAPGEDEEDDRHSDDPLEPRTYVALRRWVKRVDPLFLKLFTWTLAALLILFLCFVVFGILYSGIRYHGESYVVTVPGDCGDNSSGSASSGSGKLNLGTHGACETPYGTIVGAHNGVMAYSNCNSNFVSDDDSFIPALTLTATAGQEVQSVYAGLQWQCVEYARRYWIQQGQPEPAFFGSVDAAADIWEETTVTAVLNRSRHYSLRRYANGASVLSGNTAPKVRDLLIYSVDAARDFPVGHVAVVVALNASAVFVAEQNWSSEPWPQPFRNYSRVLPLLYDSVKLTYTIQDTQGPLLGWMRYA